ncbi:Superfamily II DNA or RNA helicase [Lactococcus garvieae]|uniref:Superfamily II DNA or RNA helicase n=2 Tax=Lactococcus garvieae TaxID=1363 RepID=A0A1I4I6T3_9LACT|nr:Superfamily II DNA or RNA helicase [Lactococcus garvieae]
MIQSPPGSGKSVIISEIARLATEKGGRVLFLVHRKELIDQITNSFKIHGVPLKQVDLLTIGKAKNRLPTLIKPTLIITDEGHHGKATTYQKIYDFFDDVPRLGFTATPWRMSGEGFKDTYEEMVEGKTVEWLINHKRLAPYQYYSLPSIDTSKLRIKNGDYSNQSIDEALGKTIFGNVVQEYKKHANGLKAILYAHSVEASKSFAQEFQEAGIQCVHVDAKTPKIERDKLMQDFREGRIKVLCNVDLISEGFDVPDCTVTILCRPTKSLVLFLQQSMRSMRYQPKKTAIIIDNVMNWCIHGLPDTPHDWQSYFEGGWKKKGQKNIVQAKQCPECSAMWPLPQKICNFCGYDFGIAEKREKLRLEVELEQIEKEKVKLKLLSEKKFSSDLRKNWEIAQARAKVNKGNPLMKLLYFYAKSDWASATLEEIAEVTGKTNYQIIKAKDWLQSKGIY